MTRKKSKNKSLAAAQMAEIVGGLGPGATAESTGADSLPNETLLLIFAKLSSPCKQYAALVCRRWHELLLDPAFCRQLDPGQSLSEALEGCAPGDTIICPPGMYQETLLVDKPVRLVARDHWLWERRQQQRRRQCRQLLAEPAAADGPGPGPGSLLLRRHQLQQRQQQQQLRQLQQQQNRGWLRAEEEGEGAAGYGGEGDGEGGRPRPAVPSVTVLSLRPPVVVMNSRCCFVGLEFHTATAHNEVSICCFAPRAAAARFEYCTFSGLTGLRVPYSMDRQTLLELYDCTLIGTTQSLAAVQMDTGRLLLVRCVLQNNSVGVEVGPEALARLERCDVRWCATALVVDGCLAMAHCRLWGNGKVGNVSTDARLQAAHNHSEACLAVQLPPEEPQQQHRVPTAAAAAAPQRPRGRGGRGSGSTATTPAAAAADMPGTAAAAAGPSAPPPVTLASPGRVAALSAAQWCEVAAAFSSREQLVRVVGCEVAAPQLIVRAGLHKEVRKKARRLVRDVYGAPDDDLFPEWEVLVHSDLDSDMDDEDSSVRSGSGTGDDDDMDDEDEDDPLDAADDPELDESGGLSSGMDSEDAGDGLGEEGEGEDEEWGAGTPMSSGGGSSSSSSSESSSSDESSSSSGGESSSSSDSNDGDG